MSRLGPTRVACWRASLVLASFVCGCFCRIGDFPLFAETRQSSDDFNEEESPTENQQKKKPQRAIDMQIQMVTREFEEVIFDQKGPQLLDAATTKLELTVLERIEFIDQKCELSDDQKEKLIRAGRRDIRNWSDRFNSVRKELCVALVENRGHPRSTGSDIERLRYEFRHGPFGDESFFAKVRSTILTDEQLARYERDRQRARDSNTIITAENVNRLTFVDRIAVTADRFEWDKQGSRLGMLELEKPLEIYSADGTSYLATVGEGRKLIGFDFNPDQNLIAFSDLTGSAFLFDLVSKQVTELRTTTANGGVQFEPDGKLLATIADKTSVSIWSVPSGKWLRECDMGEINRGIAPKFSPDGTLLACAHPRSTVLIFDVETGKLKQIIDWKPCCDLKFNPTGNLLALGFRGGNLLVCDPRTAAKLALTKTGLDDVLSLDWSKNGEMLASAGIKGAVTLWNSHDLTRLRDIEAPEHVLAVRFNPAGTRLVFLGGTPAKTIHYLETWAVPESNELAPATPNAQKARTQ
jgi:WD40 repeat protein